MSEAHRYAFEVAQWRPASFDANVPIGERKPGHITAESDEELQRKLEVFLQQQSLHIGPKVVPTRLVPGTLRRLQPIHPSELLFQLEE